MIEVIYYREHNRVTITGHAHSDEYGKDLICAAVSALALTLSANVRNLHARGYVQDAVIKLEPGDAEISCQAKELFQGSVRQVFMSVCVGFEILADKYPEHISYCVRGW